MQGFIHKRIVGTSVFKDSSCSYKLNILTLNLQVIKK